MTGFSFPGEIWGFRSGVGVFKLLWRVGWSGMLGAGRIFGANKQEKSLKTAWKDVNPLQGSWAAALESSLQNNLFARQVLALPEPA